MSTDILSVIQSRASFFSKGQRLIARYITESYDKAAFMTASRLGRTVGVSESTVVRFASELGYDGYPAMQKAMQEMVRNRLTAVQRMEVANDQIGEKDVLLTVLESDIDLLRQTSENISRAEFRATVDAILNAKRVYIIGARSAAMLARFLGYYFYYLFPNVRVITSSGTGEVFESIVGVNSEDAAVAFSFPRYAASTVKAAEYCRSTGAKVIAVTDNSASPLARCADHVLCARSGVASLADSLAAPLSVTNALIAAIASRREKELRRTFDTLESVWNEYHVYEKRDDDDKL